ncbi:MAG: GNAT family N-acetyltransferase [Deltaproteobacteria bacterium]|nr:GNAT family N-acetyltransferase [Deltaproteobacteria bacterium]
MEGVDVRKAAVQDREALVSIIEATGNLTREEKDCALELLDIYLGDPLQKDYFFIVAATNSDKPAGYACYGKTPLTDAVFDLYWILVDNGSQGRGLGSLLLGHVERLIKNEGARLLVAETSSLPAYGPAREFYLKRGFTVESRIKDFYKPGDDLITYVKRY